LININKDLKYVDCKNEKLKNLFFMHTKLRGGHDEIFAKLKGKNYTKCVNHCLNVRDQVSHPYVFR
jgi:hypothetical protein